MSCKPACDTRWGAAPVKVAFPNPHAGNPAKSVEHFQFWEVSYIILVTQASLPTDSQATTTGCCGWAASYIRRYGATTIDIRIAMVVLGPCCLARRAAGVLLSQSQGLLGKWAWALPVCGMLEQSACHMPNGNKMKLAFITHQPCATFVGACCQN